MNILEGPYKKLFACDTERDEERENIIPWANRERDRRGNKAIGYFVIGLDD